MKMHVLMAFLLLVSVTAGVSATPVQRIELNPQASWTSGSGDVSMTERWRVASMEDGITRFEVFKAKHSGVFNFPSLVAIDAEATPILSLTYIASGDWSNQPGRSVLVFYGGQPSEWPAVGVDDLQIDGQQHTLEVDLRKILADTGATSAALRRLDLRVHAGATKATLDLISLSFSPSSKQPQSAADAAELGEPVHVHVVDESGLPLAGATLTLDPHLKTIPSQSISTVAKTDAAGHATVSTADAPHKRQSLSVRHPTKTTMLFRDLSEVTSQQPLTAKLYPTRTYSGTVVNQNNKPVAGAIGIIQVRGLETGSYTGRPRQDFDNCRIITDASGRWVSPPLPDQPNAVMNILWNHEDYLSDREANQYSTSVSMPELRNGTARQVLSRGVTLTGQVLGQDGQPLSDAFVGQGKDRVTSNPPPSAVTDSNGRYVFTQVEPGVKVQLTVTAKGHAPQTKRVDAVDDANDVKFHMQPSSEYRFRIIDPRGKPLVTARIFPDTWNDIRPFNESLITDENGEVIWEGPPDGVVFDIRGTEQQDQRGIRFLPNLDANKFHVVTLPDPLRVALKVVDSETGLPVRNFLPMVGAMRQNDKYESPYFDRRSASTVISEQGRWEKTFQYPHAYRVVRVEAPGYASEDSEPIANDAGLVELRLELQPASMLQGVLTNDEGQPLSGVEVFVTEGSWALSIQNGRVGSHNEHTSVTTDKAGQFFFTKPPGPFRLVVADDAGYADVHSKIWLDSADFRIQVEPWAQISGRVLTGDQPTAHAQITLRPQLYDVDQPRGPWHSLRTTTDAAGNFSFDRVHAGIFSFGNVISLNAEGRSGYARNYQSVRIKPGQRVRLTLGGSGHALIGQLAILEEISHVVLDDAINILARVNYDEVAPLPEDFSGKTPAEKRDFFLNEYLLAQSSASSQNVTFSPRTMHRFRADADGQFRVEGVEPGEYEFITILFKPLAGTQCGFGEVLGGLSRRLEIPALPEDSTDSSDDIQLGTLLVSPAPPTLSLGDAVPDFSLPVLPNAEHYDGKPIDLGKLMHFKNDLFTDHVTLVYFGASWCAPCHAEAPYLNRVWEILKDEPRFSMLTISLDKTPSAAMTYASDKKYRWPQGFAVGGFSHEVVKSFGVGAIPSFWLIGPDGRIVAKGFRGQAIIDKTLSAVSDLPWAPATAEP